MDHRLPERRWKIVPSSAFRKADYQSMEGVMDVTWRFTYEFAGPHG